MVAVEAERLPADQQLVAVPQRRTIHDPLVVEEGAIAAFEIFDEERVAFADDRGMAPAHRGHVERDVTVAVAADDRPVAVDRIPRGRDSLSHKF